MEKTVDFEEALMERLSDVKLDKPTLKKYSSIIAGMRKRDVIIDRIWKYGQPGIDGVVVRGRLGTNDFGNLVDVMRIPEVNGIEIFPLGIPFPDLLDVRFRIGEQVAG